MSRYRKKDVAGQALRPQTQMMSFGYDPALSEGAIKPPLFQTSTFVFKSAEDGKKLIPTADKFRNKQDASLAPRPCRTAGARACQLHGPCPQRCQKNQHIGGGARKFTGMLYRRCLPICAPCRRVPTRLPARRTPSRPASTAMARVRFTTAALAAL